jgi:hypothetical protein
MLTELFPLKLEFRGLSDEDPDEIAIDSPDVDDDDDDDDDGDGGETSGDETAEPPLE